MSPEIWTAPPVCHEGFTRIGTGDDSCVYRYGDYVIKEYYKSRGDELLTLYGDVTNRAAELVEKQKMVAVFPYSHLSLPVEVNPFIHMGKCVNCGRMEGMARYIPSENLEDEYPRHFDMTELEWVLKLLSWEIERMVDVIGIDIIPRNVKRSASGALVITDLSSEIIKLRLPHRLG